MARKPLRAGVVAGASTGIERAMALALAGLHLRAFRAEVSTGPAGRHRT